MIASSSLGQRWMLHSGRIENMVVQMALCGICTNARFTLLPGRCTLQLAIDTLNAIGLFEGPLYNRIERSGQTIQRRRRKKRGNFETGITERLSTSRDQYAPFLYSLDTLSKLEAGGGLPCLLFRYINS
jgi:hypothetical protein